MKKYYYDGDVIRWRSLEDNKDYCIHIKQDSDPLNPRADDDGIFTKMACFVRGYSIGDKVSGSAEEYWQSLVREHLTEKEIIDAVKAGKIKGIRIAANEENSSLVDIYETYVNRTIFGDTEPHETLEYEGVAEDSAIYYIQDDLTIAHCMTLLSDIATWLPIWYYDHGGISITCGSRTGQYADKWDSGQAGWIICFKEDMMKQCGIEYVLDENGERIKVEHKHENAPSTYSYMTRPLTDETWVRRAQEMMLEEVEVYDQYLSGEVYGFTMYENVAEEGDEPEWEETDNSTWGFYGNDIMENGIYGEVGYGFEKAVDEDRCTEGTAEDRSYMVSVTEFCFT